jgi:hypothetical protein
MPVRRLALALWGFLALSFPTLAGASDSGAAPSSAIEREVEAILPTLDREDEVFDEDQTPAGIYVTVWRDDGIPRKMVVEFPDDHGSQVTSYYFAPTGLVLIRDQIITQAIDGSSESSRESLYGFEHGRMVQWRKEDQTLVPSDDPTFPTLETALLNATAVWMGRMDERAAEKGPVQWVDGVFQGFEEGDYVYLLLEVDGELQSFMVGQVDEAVDILLADPDPHVGQTITVGWRASMENIPEAGGQIAVDSLVTVKVPGP